MYHFYMTAAQIYEKERESSSSSSHVISNNVYSDITSLTLTSRCTLYVYINYEIGRKHVQKIELDEKLVYKRCTCCVILV